MYCKKFIIAAFIFTFIWYSQSQKFSTDVTVKMGEIYKFNPQGNYDFQVLGESEKAYFLLNKCTIIKVNKSTLNVEATKNVYKGSKYLACSFSQYFYFGNRIYAIALVNDKDQKTYNLKLFTFNTEDLKLNPEPIELLVFSRDSVNSMSYIKYSISPNSQYLLIRCLVNGPNSHFKYFVYNNKLKQINSGVQYIENVKNSYTIMAEAINNEGNVCMVIRKTIEKNKIDTSVIRYSVYYFANGKLSYTAIVPLEINTHQDKLIPTDSGFFYTAMIEGEKIDEVKQLFSFPYKSIMGIATATFLQSGMARSNSYFFNACDTTKQNITNPCSIYNLSKSFNHQLKKIIPVHDGYYYCFNWEHGEDYYFGVQRSVTKFTYTGMNILKVDKFGNANFEWDFFKYFSTDIYEGLEGRSGYFNHDTNLLVVRHTNDVYYKTNNDGITYSSKRKGILDEVEIIKIKNINEPVTTNLNPIYMDKTKAILCFPNAREFSLNSSTSTPVILYYLKENKIRIGVMRVKE